MLSLTKAMSGQTFPGYVWVVSVMSVLERGVDEMGKWVDQRLWPIEGLKMYFRMG